LAVSSGLGVSVVPDVAVAEPVPDVVIRPLRPALPCTLGLVERRNRPDEPATDIVRNALLELQVIKQTAATKVAVDKRRG
jgi:DNA-binding transcriptional LysR family regulator